MYTLTHTLSYTQPIISTHIMAAPDARVADMQSDTESDEPIVRIKPSKKSLKEKLNVDKLVNQLAHEHDLESEGISTEDLDSDEPESGDGADSETVLQSGASTEDEEGGSSSSEDLSVNLSDHPSDEEKASESDDSDDEGESTLRTEDLDDEDNTVNDSRTNGINDIPTVSGINKRKRRFRSGTVALREIRKYQRTTDLLIAKKPFERLVREIAQDYKTDMCFTKDSILAIQTAAEEMLTDLFQTSQLMAIHANRQEIQPKDIQLTRRAGGIFHWDHMHRA
jgi:histone H3